MFGYLGCPDEADTGLVAFYVWDGLKHNNYVLARSPSFSVLDILVVRSGKEMEYIGTFIFSSFRPEKNWKDTLIF